MEIKDVKCPYCGEWQEINHDDGYGYEENEIFSQECDDCGKTFAYTTTVTFNHRASKAECMNGGQHKLESVKHFPKYFPNWVRCTECGYEDQGKVDVALLRRKSEVKENESTSKRN